MTSDIIDITLGLIAYAISIKFSWTDTIALFEKKNAHIIFIQPKVLKILTVKLHFYCRKTLQTIHLDFNKIGNFFFLGRIDQGRND